MVVSLMSSAVHSLRKTSCHGTYSPPPPRFSNVFCGTYPIEINAACAGCWNYCGVCSDGGVM